MIFDLEDDLGSLILFQKWILEVRIIWKRGITLLSRHISSKDIFSSLSEMLIKCLLVIMQIKKFPKVAVVATKLNFLQYTYRFRIDHETLYSQTFPCPHFGSWTSMANRLNGNKSKRLYIFKRMDRVLIGNNKKITNSCKSSVATNTFIWFITYSQNSLIDVAYLVLAHLYKMSCN